MPIFLKCGKNQCDCKIIHRGSEHESERQQSQSDYILLDRYTAEVNRSVTLLSIDIFLQHSELQHQNHNLNSSKVLSAIKLCPNGFVYLVHYYVHCIILRGKLKEAATEYKSHVHRGGTCDSSCLLRYN